MTRKPGRPRDPSRDAVILDATVALLTEGYAALSIEAIAREAGVSKATVYRRWTSVGAIVADALFGRIPELAQLPDTGTLRGDLERLLRALAAVLGSDLMKAALPGLMGQLATDEAVQTQLRSAFVADARDRLGAVFARAVERGEIHDAVPHPTVGAALVGALVFRSVVAGRPLEDDFVDELLVLALDGLRPRPSPIA